MATTNSPPSPNPSLPSKLNEARSHTSLLSDDEKQKQLRKDAVDRANGKLKMEKEQQERLEKTTLIPQPTMNIKNLRAEDAMLTLPAEPPPDAKTPITEVPADGNKIGSVTDDLGDNQIRVDKKGEEMDKRRENSSSTEKLVEDRLEKEEKSFKSIFRFLKSPSVTKEVPESTNHPVVTVSPKSCPGSPGNSTMIKSLSSAKKKNRDDVKRSRILRPGNPIIVRLNSSSFRRRKSPMGNSSHIPVPRRKVKNVLKIRDPDPEQDPQRKDVEVDMDLLTPGDIKQIESMTRDGKDVVAKLRLQFRKRLEAERERYEGSMNQQKKLMARIMELETEVRRYQGAEERWKKKAVSRFRSVADEAVLKEKRGQDAQKLIDEGNDAKTVEWIGKQLAEARAQYSKDLRSAKTATEMLGQRNSERQTRLGKLEQGLDRRRVAKGLEGDKSSDSEVIRSTVDRHLHKNEPGRINWIRKQLTEAREEHAKDHVLVATETAELRDRNQQAQSRLRRLEVELDRRRIEEGSDDAENRDSNAVQTTGNGIFRKLIKGRKEAKEPPDLRTAQDKLAKTIQTVEVKGQRLSKKDSSAVKDRLRKKNGIGSGLLGRRKGTTDQESIPKNRTSSKDVPLKAKFQDGKVVQPPLPGTTSEPRTKADGKPRESTEKQIHDAKVQLQYNAWVNRKT